MLDRQLTTPKSDATASSDDRSTLIIVGNGMVSHELCRGLADRGLPNTYRVVVFGDEPRPAYDRVRLTSCFTKPSADELQLGSAAWYEQRGIELFVGECITDVDLTQRRVTSNSGRALDYDQLVLATGSIPFIPPIEGTNLPGVFPYRTIEHLQEIREYSHGVKSAAVLGGGLLGLEAARALFDAGLETHVIEVAPGLMPRQLDRDGGQLLKRQIEQLGVNIHLVKRTERITVDGNQRILHFDNGPPLAVEMVVISAGIRPRDELAKTCDLELGPRGGFKVDSQLRTSDPNVFAVGECASHEGVIYGLVGPGYQMAHVLAKNLAGEDDHFLSGDQSARLKLMGVSVATLGTALGEAEGVETVHFESDDAYRMVTTRGGRIVGAISVGDWPEVERIRTTIELSHRIWPWQLRRFKTSGNLWRPGAPSSVCDWPMNATVCSCMGITREALGQAQAGGCDTVEAIAAKTGASTVCGSCKPLLAELVGDAAQQIVRGWKMLLTASVCALLAFLAYFAIGRFDAAQSVQSDWHHFDMLLEDFIWKQATGFTLLGLSAIAMLLSFRKRWKRFKWGDFGYWRAIHGSLGLLTLMGLAVHTGMHLGSNLNLMLGVVFLGVNLLGAGAGIASSLEHRVKGDAAILLRRWRPRLTTLHILLLWPFPVLLVFHVVAAYYY